MFQRMWNLHLKNIVFFPLDQIQLFFRPTGSMKKTKIVEYNSN